MQDGTVRHSTRKGNPLSDCPAVQDFLRLGDTPQTAPTAAPVHAIHRGPDGYVPLAVQHDGAQWEELGALRVGQPLLPELLPLLTHDAYFGVNSTFGKSKPKFTLRQRWQPIPTQPGAEERRAVAVPTWTHPHTGLPYTTHDNNSLRWLNVCYADVDCYQFNRSVGDTLGAIFNLQDDGTLPPASLFVRSGRGLWAMWLLVDLLNPPVGEKEVHGVTHRPYTPQRASVRAVRLYARVQHAIVNRLAHLGADLGAMDGPRFAPFPGTTKTRGGGTVQYWVQVTDDGVPCYTLASLADAFGLELQQHEHRVIEAAFPAASRNPLKQAAGRKGHRQRWRYTLADLETLYELRGGYGDVNSRHRAALFHAVALKRAGMADAEMQQRVTKYWNRSLHSRPGDVPPPSDVDAVFRQARKKQTPFTRMAREAYLRELRVTDVERGYLDAVSQRPRATPSAPTTRASQATRRAAIQDAVMSVFGGTPPSLRSMAAHLAAQGIPGGNWTTVRLDYKFLGYAVRHAAGRPPKLPL